MHEPTAIPTLRLHGTKVKTYDSFKFFMRCVVRAAFQHATTKTTLLCFSDITVGPSVQLMRLKVSIRLCLFTSFTYFFYQGIQTAKKDFKKKYALAVFATKSVAQVKKQTFCIQTCI